MFNDITPMYNGILIKLYDRTGAFKKTLTGDKLVSTASFSEILNFGYTGFNFKYAEAFDTDLFAHGDQVVVLKGGSQPLYKGLVYEINRVINTSGVYIEVSTQGMLSLLNFVLFEDDSNYAFSLNKDASEMIEDIFSVANVGLGTSFSWDGESLPTYGTSLQLDFDHDTCFSALMKVLEITSYGLRVDGADKVRFFDLSTTSTHALTFKNHVNELYVKEKSDKLINSYRLTYSSGTATDTDATSISIYGERLQHINKPDIKNSPTASEYLSSLLLRTKEPVLNTKIVVNRNYNLELLKVGDQVSIKNLGNTYIIEQRIIEKLDYKGDYVILYLDGYDTIAKSLSEI